MLNLENIPIELKEKGLFCFVKNDEKAPYQCELFPIQKAKSNNPSTFTNYKEAYELLKAQKLLNGKEEFYTLGILAGNEIGFIDLDHCIENGNIKRWAKDIIDYFNSYTEISTSGTGIHIYIKCTDFIKRYSKEAYKNIYGERKDNIECYLSGISTHYAIMTGNKFPNSSNEIKDVSDKIESFLDSHLRKKPLISTPVQNESPNNLSDQELIKLIQNSKQANKFNRLFFDGNISGYKGISEADYGLACILAFYCGNDPERIKSLMRQSALPVVRIELSENNPYKYDTHKTYLDITVKNAIEAQTNFYNHYQNAKEDFKDIEVKKTKKKEPVKLNYITDKDTEIKPINWLWYPYIPRGAVTLLGAPPGIGKTYLTSWISSQVSNGLTFPYDNEINSDNLTGNILFLSEEDDYKSTIIPRYYKNGGKTGKLFYLNRDERPNDFSDPRLIQMVNDIKPDLIIFDAMSSYLGKVNANTFTDVRLALKPLLELIEDTNTAVVAITHFNKMNSETNALARFSGSVDFTAFARSCLTVGLNPKNKKQIIMAQCKNNFAPFGDSLGFHLETKKKKNYVAPLIFDSIVEITADELCGKSRNKSPVVDETKEKLYQILKDNNFRVRAKTVFDILLEQNISKNSIYRAKDKLNIQIDKVRENDKTVSYWFIESDFPQE